MQNDRTTMWAILILSLGLAAGLAWFIPERSEADLIGSVPGFMVGVLLGLIGGVVFWHSQLGTKHLCRRHSLIADRTRTDSDK